MSPAVSVILPVWNCPGYVGPAIESILVQTYRDFEFLIIDDGSTDDTPGVLRRYTDPRIRHIRQENRGLAGTLNVGIGLARGKYIVRQDQDDLSLPDRLARQVQYMDAHPDCGLLGTWAQILKGDHLLERFHRHPADSSRLRYELLLNNPFVHSSVILRKSVLDATGGYTTDPERQPPEDFELWSRISRVATVSNIPEIHLYYREISGSMSRMGSSPFQSRLVKLCSENIALAAGVGADDPSAIDIAAITHGAFGMVSKRPDFQRMTALFLEAASNVAGDQFKNEILADAKNRITAMRAMYYMEKIPFRNLISNQTPLRSLLKRVYRFVLGKNRGVA